MQLGRKLKKLRLQKGLTQEDVARKIGVSRQAYNAYEQSGTRPRNKATYEELAKVLGCDVNYLLKEDYSVETTLAALGAISSVVPVLGSSLAIAAATGVRLAEKGNKKGEEDKLIERVENVSKENLALFSAERLDEYNRQRHRFAVTATGLLYGQLIQKGFRFRPCNVNELTFQCYDDDAIVKLEDCSINIWLFKFVAFSEDDRMLDDLVKDMALNVMSRLVFISNDAKRKVSIVVNDMELYNHLLRYKGCNSYRGNLSVILIDTKEVSIRKEDYLSVYDFSNEEKLLEIV